MGQLGTGIFLHSYSNSFSSHLIFTPCVWFLFVITIISFSDKNILFEKLCGVMTG